ncbi:hypothetical protein GMRT_11421 [Giardia muris]|uniref:Uncharacterized protein n=1 Tax=Giardia muris TaxID=5742 RepID=A0A4Z1T704_GIAMU|nr:hypothetical protein GMRT_11421 [Giardia muris]|eukprot:TNJ28281.1 hypothetical protein GMRT_11421 [Giardia muris]
MDAFMDEDAFRQLLDESACVRFTERDVSARPEDVEPHRLTYQKREATIEDIRRGHSHISFTMSGETPEQIRERIEKRVNGMSIRDMTVALLNERQLLLNRDEQAELRALERRRLLEHGASVSKRRYLPFNKLKELRQAQSDFVREQLKENRNAGLIGLGKNGRKYTIGAGITENVHDLTWEKVHPSAAIAYRQLSDHRGRAYMWDGSKTITGTIGHFENGELKLKQSTIERLGGKMSKKVKRPHRKEQKKGKRHP